MFLDGVQWLEVFPIRVLQTVGNVVLVEFVVFLDPTLHGALRGALELIFDAAGACALLFIAAVHRHHLSETSPC